ncbi:MAG: ATP-dependent DNA helicase [Candidatus Aenigmarchaeota archaeon]|nr:ATP-dependent DNA helicase [Candidatus Aenigmarchaeota archaeon]
MQPSKEQEEIIKLDKNTIVISNPGTGKTTTLSLKVLDLLSKGVKPERILCITFTEKAKKEMFETIFDLTRDKFTDAEIMKLNVHTFHSFAYNYLIDAGFITGDIIGNNVLRFSILKSFEDNKAFNYGKDYIISDIVPKTENAIRYIKSFGITPEKIELDKVQKELEDIYEDKNTSFSLKELQAFCRYFVDAYKRYENSKEGNVDYSDMLLLFLKNFKGDKFDFVLVDEMQDMNELEAEIAQKVSKTIFLVGDAKQAIFGFQGGSIKNFTKYMKICERKLLSTNRRSCQQILDYSKGHFLNKTKQRGMFEEELECFKAIKNGDRPKVISTKAHFSRVLNIIESNPEKTIGVITRTNRQLIELSEYLDMNNISYSSTSSQATTQNARDEIIRFLRGLLLDEVEERISATFSLFAPYTLKEAFEISELYKNRQNLGNRLKKLDNLFVALNKNDIDKLFNNIILPVCISKGSEWFTTGISIKAQIEEYLAMKIPTKNDFFDFMAITEEKYIERNTESRITLTTVHKAKGLGFDIVIYMPSASAARTSFVDMVVEAILNSKGINVKEELEEEMIRIDFVAFTRAKERLFILTDDKNMRNYHIEDLSEIEVDAKEEEIVATKLNNRISEAFSLFVAGRFDESKKLLKSEDKWLKDFIISYFKKLELFSYSMITNDPYHFLMGNIIAMPKIFAPITFGKDVHDAMDDIFKNKVKIDELEGDEKKAVENGIKAIEQLKKDHPGLSQLYSEKRMLLPLSSVIDYKDKKLMIKGFIDAVFKHDKGYILIDYKTDKNSSYATDAKKQLAVYRKMISVLENIPEEQIKIFVLYIALRGSINTGRFDWEIEKENRNAFPTFEKHLRKVLEWKDNPDLFIKEILECDQDDLLTCSIKEKLGDEM